MKRIFIFALLACLAVGLQAKPKKVKETKFAGYLFTYFEGRGEGNLQEQLRFAISEDGVNWHALNGNRPVIASDTISTTGGIRDPHILRGEDGDYYIVATDMFTIRDGWGSNPGIVMLKSKDLVNWTHGKVVLSKDFAKNFGDAYWVWAPQTIYDRKAKKYMVYFTLQRNDRKSLITYYAYANKDFTGFESEPKVLFAAKYGSIDADIIYKDGLYHLFYKGNTRDANGREVQNGIQQATSKNLLGPYVEDFKYLDAYANNPIVVEGSGIFKLNDSDEYVLMYDLYSNGRYEFQRSKDLFNFTQEPESFTKDFFPRHGTVCSITAEEMARLKAKWGGYSWTATGNPVVQHKYTADPATMVDGDTLYVFTGEDDHSSNKGYQMKQWCVFSTTDMKHWREYETPLRVADFAWAANGGKAYAGHAIRSPHDGKYYWYISTDGPGIGVAVSDGPTGPYKDAIGKPLLTVKDCFDSKHYWACIDPAIFIDDDGTPWLFFGNQQCYYVKLKTNMVELDGAVKRVNFPGLVFEEAPWVHKHDGKYYLSYASHFPERTEYAMADNIEGPWTYGGILNEVAGNSDTNHHAVVDFKGKSYFVYHNGALKGGGSHNRAMCVDYLRYNADRSIQRVQMTSEGVVGD